ncbi:hypothetical protein ABZ612_29000 [Streptomyces avermitilis]|uniref:hypothetical protein n=1 Tax=Streptomyces avermitilis TaxID=33903 RepID=UPI0033DFA727
MWPGEQPTGGGQNPQQSADGTPPNPYQQPGYHQTNPYGQQPQPPSQPQPQPQPWNAPTQPAGAPVSPPTGGGNRTKVVAIVAAAAVVIAAGVTGFVLLGGGKDDRADPDPTKSVSPQPSSSNPRGTDTDRATIKGWKVVKNPQRHIAFDVPPQWALKASSWVTYVSENDDPDDTPLIGMSAPAYLKEQWCGSDDDRDGTKEYAPLAGAGSRRSNGAKTPAEAARNDAATWVYGAYAQPDKKLVTSGAVESFTTKSGITGSLATASSSGVEKSKKCRTDGKATVFAFKDDTGDIVSWAFFGARGVSDEVPDATVKQILGTVRLYKDPSDS